MVLESALFLIIKAKAIDAWKVIKKYWQFFLGLSVGLFVFLFFRDSGKVKETIKVFKESSDSERERSLEISEEENNNVIIAIDKFKDNIDASIESLDERDKEISSERDKIRDDLLEKEESERGTIASEIEKELDNI